MDLLEKLGRKRDALKSYGDRISVPQAGLEEYRTLISFSLYTEYRNNCILY
jgi:hypothetical protein